MLIKYYSLYIIMNKIKSIYKEYSETKKETILELILNLYLMKCNYRNIFQIYVSDTKILKVIKQILNEISYDYLIDNKTGIRVIVYDKKTFNIDDLDMTFGKKYAKQLGEFYTCATDDYQDNNYRIVIQVGCINTQVELYAQMCKKNMITKNINKTIKIFDEIRELIKKLDDNLHIQIQIYSRFK